MVVILVLLLSILKCRQMFDFLRTHFWCKKFVLRKDSMLFLKSSIELVFKKIDIKDHNYRFLTFDSD